MADDTIFPYDTLSRSAGNKKFVSATAVADLGNSQALAVKPSRPTFTAWEIGGYRLTNRSGAPVLAGLAVPFAPASWVAGQVTAAGAFTADTADAQEATTNDFLLYQHLIADGNGFLLGATEPFNCFSLLQSTAGNQTTPVLVPEFWDGTTWADLTPYLLYNDTFIVGTTEKLVVWSVPNIWVVGGSGTLVPQTLYNLRIRHTVAGQGTIDPLAAQIFLGVARGLAFVPVDGVGQWSGPPVRLPKAGAALHPLFTTADAENFVEVQVRYWQ
jgi:hypothetical protein